jgi:hypothetical protein
MVRCLFLALLAGCVLLLPTPLASAAAPSEAAVKAAFLPRFARYVTWPPTARPALAQPVQLCTIGHDPFGSLLEQAVRNQGIDGHRVVVRRLGSAAASRGCHMAYVAPGTDYTTAQLLAELGRRPVLTVTDSRTGTQRGIIHFATVGGRVRFFIDEAAARERGLVISSRLLSLAVAVRTH